MSDRSHLLQRLLDPQEVVVVDGAMGTQHHPEAKYFAVRGAQAPATTNEEVALDRAAAGEVSLAEARADT